MIIEEGFGDSDDLTGVFTGFDPETHSYDAERGPLVLRGFRRGQQGRRGRLGPQEEPEAGQHGTHGYGQMGVGRRGGLAEA